MLLAAGVAAALVLAGCGGGGHEQIVAPKQTERKSTLLGGAASAGETESYSVTGDVIADNGFRPWIDGFGFENYGNDAGPENMTPANMVDLLAPTRATRSTSNLKIPQGELALVVYREMGGRNEPVQVFTASGDGKKITSAGQELQPDSD
jgi:hypothetical protein